MTRLTFYSFVLVLSTFVSCETKNNRPKPEPNPKTDTIERHLSDTTKPKIVDLTTGDKSGKLMNEDDFWKIIDQSRTISANVYQVQIQSLKVILSGLDPSQIIKFDNTFNALLAATYDYKLWGASYVINGGCSDDCFEYFREYLLAHGKGKFYETVKDPESCVTWIKTEMDDNWEGIRYCAPEAYKTKTGKEMPRDYQPVYKLKGKQFNEATVDKQYPKLAKKFSGMF